jgi:hypothetical protein
LGGGNALSNSDFRKFLMTPRATDTEEGVRIIYLFINMAINEIEPV